MTDDLFWAKVDKTDTCWLWTGALSPSGYGVVRRNYRTKRPHRYAYELLIGPIPPGYDLDHLCRVRNCVNPAHLEPVTRKENLQRGANGALKTHCPHGHPYTEANTYRRPGTGWRMCRICGGRKVNP